MHGDGRANGLPHLCSPPTHRCAAHGYAPRPGMTATVVLYATSCAATVKAKSDIHRIKNLLDAKRVHYEEVRARHDRRNSSFPPPRGLAGCCRAFRCSR